MKDCCPKWIDDSDMIEPSSDSPSRCGVGHYTRMAVTSTAAAWGLEGAKAIDGGGFMMLVN